MGKYCLTKDLADAFKKRLASGEIDPDKLAGMNSEGRHKFFKKFLDEENATNINSLFESKLLQKYKWNAMLNWAKEVTGIKPPVRRDLMSRIEKMAADQESILNVKTEEAFLRDLATTRLGMGVTFDEVKRITDLSDLVAKAKSKMNPETFKFKNEDEALKFGLRSAILQDYVAQLRVNSKKLTAKEYLMKPHEVLYDIGGTTKSLLASLDNSFFGRQGIKVLFTHPVIWTKNFAKSWGDIGQGLLKRDTAIPIKAQIMSRQNHLNGKFKVMGVDLELLAEEAFPSSLPERIPLFGRLFKASENAFNGAALRMRADLADLMIKKAEKAGVNMLDPREAEGLGHLINSLTGRGDIGKAGAFGHELNVTTFSVKFFKSNIDTLLFHQLHEGMSWYARKEAAKHTLKILGSMAGTLVIADALHPGSVEWDMTSSDFGKIKIKNTKFDITGGMSSLAVLAGRLAKGSIKSASTGKKVELKAGYGTATRASLFYSFMEGKLSPLAGVVRDWMKDERFGGEELTPTTAIKGLVTPLPIDTYQDLMKDPNSANMLMSMIAEGLGFSTSSYPPSSINWNKDTGVILSQFKEKVGKDKFDEANKKYNETVSNKIIKLKTDDRYKKLSADDKGRLLLKMKTTIKNNIFKEYGFKYKKAGETKEEKNINKEIKEMSDELTGD